MTAAARTGLSFATAPDMLRVDEAAGLLRVGSGAVYSAVAAGSLRACKIGRSVRISKLELRRFAGLLLEDGARSA